MKNTNSYVRTETVDGIVYTVDDSIDIHPGDYVIADGKIHYIDHYLHGAIKNGSKIIDGPENDI